MRGGTREASGMQETLYILSWAVVTQVCSLCKTNRAICLRCRHFTVCMLHENFVKNAWPNLAISIKITNAQNVLVINPTDISPCYKMIQVSFGWTVRLFSFCHYNQGCGEYPCTV